MLVITAKNAVQVSHFPRNVYFRHSLFKEWRRALKYLIVNVLMILGGFWQINRDPEEAETLHCETL